MQENAKKDSITALFSIEGNKIPRPDILAWCASTGTTRPSDAGNEELQMLRIMAHSIWLQMRPDTVHPNDLTGALSFWEQAKQNMCTLISEGTWNVIHAELLERNPQMKEINAGKFPVLPQAVENLLPS